MNSKLQQLVSLGLGAIALAILTVSMGQNIRSSFEAAGADFDASGYALTDDCCTSGGRCAPCPPPPSRG